MYGPLYSVPAFFLLLPLASRLFRALSLFVMLMCTHTKLHILSTFFFFLLCTTTVSPYHLQGMLRFIEHTIPDQSFTFCLFVFNFLFVSSVSVYCSGFICSLLALPFAFFLSL